MGNVMKQHEKKTIYSLVKLNEIIYEIISNGIYDYLRHFFKFTSLYVVLCKYHRKFHAEEIQNSTFLNLFKTVFNFEIEKLSEKARMCRNNTKMEFCTFNFLVLIWKRRTIWMKSTDLAKRMNKIHRKYRYHSSEVDSISNET